MGQFDHYPVEQSADLSAKEVQIGSGAVVDTPVWSAIADQSPLPVASVQGKRHNIAYVNPAFCRLLGSPSEELIGRRFCEIVPRADVCSLLLDRVYSTGEAETYTDGENAGFHPAFHSLVIWPIYSTGSSSNGAESAYPPEIAIVVTETTRLHQQASALNQQLLLTSVRQHELADTAERASAQENAGRLRAEEAVRKSEARFRALANAVPNMVWSADASGKTDLVNDWWYRYTGLTPEQSLGKWGFLAAVHPEDRARTSRAWAEAVQSGGSYEVECRLRRASDGVYRVHLARGVPVRETEDDQIRWFGTCTDIEDLKKVHQSLIRSEKLASAGRMAASVAHEINNPLEAVLNALYLAQTDEGVPESTRAYLKIAEDELMRISHIARQSLGFYRETSAPTTVSISSLLDSTLGLLQSKVQAKHVTVEKRYEEHLEVKGIAGELRQVFANLLVNSLDAVSNQGAVTLRASISSRCGNGNHYVRVTVADNGHGIDPSARQRIFEPFFTTKGDIGTGLGLWVTKQLIDKHGGSIRVRSSIKEPHRGTVFSVLLPSADAFPTDGQRAPEAAA